MDKPAILVVDDDISYIEDIKDLLTPLGYSFLEAEKYNEAMKILKSQNVQIVIANLFLKGENGFYFIRQLKKLLPHKPVIAISSDPTNYSLSKALRMGADDFLERPFRKYDLMSSIMRFLRIEGTEINQQLTNQILIPRRKTRILIIDDDEKIQAGLKKTLSDRNYEIKTFETAIPALELLEKRGFDLVITDIMMPQINGFEFIEILRKKGMNLPVIFITGHAAEYGALEAFHKGAWDYIEKPFGADQIIHAVERALEKRKVDLEKVELIRELKAAHFRLMKTLSEFKKMDAQLVQTGKLAALGQLGGGIAHEINQPLTVIKGYAQILLSNKDELKDEQKKGLMLVDKEADRIARIVENLRKFAASEKQFAGLRYVNNAIDDALMLFREDFKKRGIHLIEKIQSDLPKLRFKSADLQQVVINLILNASDAIEAKGEKGGTITIESFQKEKKLYIAVKDNGEGIDKQVEHSIFDPFFTMRKKKERIGLGLSLSYGIIQELGGTIHVKSKLGKGSTFTIELPIPEEDEKLLKKAA